ncbi:DNA polymerase III subunit delta' [Vibrio nigripulchritudo ATCC 27043]|uniref:DNA polymerase III subunit delta' n=1 Tax=Vibrio nigripulchritudo TaxID=28173 RepID=UPI00021C3EE2|nr:DNA polymerase III subunit delta' [Vibrio nigripulchritudo]EGU55909.1 DNA polymerase III subunit delta' [Vibrio nigripulchritudo ATCC 27043]
MDALYPWLQTTWEHWQALLRNDRVTGALLCHAHSGLGAEQLASKFGEALVCVNSDDDACGFCHSCDLSKSGSHPDIHQISPEKEGKTISVDQIRQANRWALESSQLGGKRLIVIAPAEAMNESASNALLKTLESPAENCVFLLLTGDKHQLLPTIVSRCQQWDIVQPDQQQAMSWLNQNSDKPVSELALKLTHGAPLSAQAFVESGSEKVFLEMTHVLVEQLSEPIPSFGQVWKSLKDAPVERLGWLSILLTDIQKSHFVQNQEKQVEPLAKLVSYDLAYKKTREVNQLIHQLKTFPGLNAELLTAEWFLDLHEKKNVC